jgi:RHS repeat-associated protein
MKQSARGKLMNHAKGMALVLTAVAAALPAHAQTYSRTDTITYADNLSKWVIGQQASSTNVETGLIESRTVYDPVTALPLETYSFQKVQQRMTYNADGTLATMSDGRDTGTYNTTVTLSNWKRGIPQTITFPDTGNGLKSKSAVVDAIGQILSVTDETGAKTCYGYDLMGRINKITYPSESQTGVCAEYNTSSNPSGWNPTILSFTSATSAKYGLPIGHWEQTVTTGNGINVTYYDALWRPVVTERYDSANPTGTRAINVTRYDADGRPVYQSYPLTSLTSYAAVTQGTRTYYDALGRSTKVEQDSELGVLTTTTAYLTGFKTQVTLPKHQGASPAITTTTSYKTYDQPTTDWPVGITHPEGAYTNIFRDTFGKPTTLVRNGANNSPWNGRYFVYNDYQELCKRVELETGTTVMGYDAAGNLDWSAAGLPWSSTTSCTDVDPAGRVVDRSYDQRNRLVSLTFPITVDYPNGAGTSTYTYTPDGLQDTVTVDNGNGNVVTTSYNYSKRRLLSSEQMSWGSTLWTLGYGYSPNGHLQSQSYPNGHSVGYAPNALGQPTRVDNIGAANPHAWGVQYFPNGAIRTFAYGSGEVHSMQQNARGLPEHSRDSYSNDTIALLDDYYDYDANGNVVAITDGRTGRGNRDMTYDGLDRLKTVMSPMYGVSGASYTYDVLDNLTRVTVGGAAARDHYYCYDTGWHLTNVKTGTCTGASVIGLGYDTQGNLANKNGTLYHFDFGNRLRDVTWNGATTESYVYDGLGRRVGATTPAGTIYSIYSQAGQLMYQLNERRGKRIDYIYLAGSLINEFETDTTTGVAANRFQHTDALGTPIVVTNGSHTELERNEYEPFGKVTNHPVIDGPGYTGHVEDAATGLTYMQQRYYDPAIGRFLSVDPVTADGATGGNFNRYWYANNNPYRFTDPDGRKPVDDSPEHRPGPTPVRPIAPPKPPPPPRTPQQKINDSVAKNKIDTKGADVVYDKTVKSVDASPIGKDLVLIFPSAFKSDAYLAQTIIHEIVHIAQNQQERSFPNGYGAAMNEAEAFKVNIENAGRLGSSPTELRGYETQFHRYYDGLPPQYKDQVDRGFE